MNKADEEKILGFCSECKIQSFVRYSNWINAENKQIVSKKESLCTSCFRKRVGVKIF